MPPQTVSAAPLALLDVARRTGPTDDHVRREAAPLDGLLAAAVGAGPGLGAAAAAHVARGELLAATAAITGTAILLAGGVAGALVLGLRAAGRAGSLGPGDAAQLLAVALGLSGVPGSAVDRPDVDPAVVAALAELVGDDVLREVAAYWPHLVGPVDGMPIDLRYAANRVLARQAGLDELAAPGRQLLYLDPARGHVAEVFDDLHTADHVAVVVPGMGNHLGNFQNTRSKAEALRQTAADLDPPEDVATIAWLGYDSPSWDVLVDDEGRTGAAHLARFVDGVVAGGVDADTTLTVVGHSYGSLVTGLSLQEGLDVDAVAVTGSPGMGGSSADDLGATPIYALRSPFDPISYSENFGTDPTEPDFGATRLEADGVIGHSSYFELGSVALANIALVASGRADEASRDGASLFEDTVEVVDDAHRVAVRRPTDRFQEVAGFAAGVASDITDDIEGVLPGPAEAVVDAGQDVAGAAFELGNHAVDFGQRVTSPDFAGDVVEDAYEVVSDFVFG